MNISKAAYLKLDVFVLPLANWRKSYNICLKYAFIFLGQAPNAKFILPCDRFPPSQFSSVGDYSWRHRNISHFQRRSL